MSAYQEFTGKSVEEALKAARETFKVELNDLDFEILTPGSRGVLGMGAEPARIVAAPRQALGGSAPKREAAASTPLSAAPPRDDRAREDRPREDRPRDDRPPRRDGDRDRGPRRDDRPRDAAPAPRVEAPRAEAVRPAEDRPRDDRPRTDRPRNDRPPRREGDRPGGDRPVHRAPSSDLTEREAAEVAAARGSVAAERADLEAADASPEALAAGKDILENLMRLMDFDVSVEIRAGDTSRLNVIGEGDEKEALGALIGRKGERLSALQHLVNLMLSRRMGDWTRVLVDVEDYRGRRERQLVEIARRAAERVGETGKMLQLEPMSALERRWIHIALRDNPDVATQSIGEEPNRRVIVLPRA
ncbi:MAG TPA: RNA-binding cell elongation regulator Jag/EloR [Candidatus Limnocylindrales bacterium]|jgi:spoIIIJ-associated protein